MAGVVASAAYLPRWRLARHAAGIGKGTRAVASFDEDATSMAVEAGRQLLDKGIRNSLDSILFCTTSPPYADRTNATAIHRALGLAATVGAYDMVGSLRSTVGAVRAAAAAAAAGRSTLVLAGDVRIGLPGAADERDGGDGAAALLFGDADNEQATFLGAGTATSEFLDRWRIPGDATSKVWEERFGETEYGPAAHDAFSEALKVTGVAAADIDHLVVTGLHRRAVAAAAATAGVRPEAIVSDLNDTIGVTGAAHPLLLLSDVLERAKPGQVVALLVLADGADCLIFRTGGAAGHVVASRSVKDQLPGLPIAYQDMLVWRGLLRRDPPRRPDPDRPAAPPASRNAGWKFGLVGSRCSECGTSHLPPERVCMSCRSVGRMEHAPFADVGGTITTFTVDHLAISVAPPVVVVVVDFDGGGRIQCELTDVDPNTVNVGDRVEMTFRRLHSTADGVHNYFWKARLASVRRD